MATHVSLHDQHFWTPSSHIRVKYSGSKRPSAQQQDSPSPDSAEKPSRIPSSRSGSHVSDDQTAKRDEIISISSDEESDVEHDSHDDESLEILRHMSNRSTPASIVFQGSTNNVCTRIPSMSIGDECTEADDNQEATLSPGLLLGNVDWIYTCTGAAPMVTDLANIADNPEHAHPGDSLPSVKAVAASAKEQAGDTDSVGM